MRPVERGPHPTDTNGNPKVFAAYADARSDLFDRIGRYCSFCERLIKAGLAVEHVRPKKWHPELELEWTNFLLACTNCNSTKGVTEVRRGSLVLPDQDNTFLAIVYSPAGVVRANPLLPAAEQNKASKTIKLVGLDQLPTKKPKASDLRWNDRREAWDKATRYRNKFENGEINREIVVDLCLAEGHWSIWMTVFAAHSTILTELIDRFPGTKDARCFDGQGRPLPRP